MKKKRRKIIFGRAIFECSGELKKNRKKSKSLFIIDSFSHASETKSWKMKILTEENRNFTKKDIM